jgi:hypothetical protein
MITIHRSASIAPGKMVSALAFAREIAEYIKAKTGMELTIAMQIGGDPSRISWSGQNQSLAAYEEVGKKLMGDPKYLEIAAKSADLFIVGSMRDELWNSI